MTSRQVRFVLAGMTLVAATLIGQYSGDASQSTPAFWALFDIGLVVLAARGHRTALWFLIANAGLFGMLMLLFGTDPRMTTDGACFVTAAFVLFTLRNDTRRRRVVRVSAGYDRLRDGQLG